MKTAVIGIGAFVLFVLFVTAIGWFAQGNDFLLFKMFAPKYEKVRRETFEQTKSYNQGMVQELQNMQFQYIQADDAHKAALGTLILHRAADYPEDKLPTDLRDFIKGLKPKPEKTDSATNQFK